MKSKYTITLFQFSKLVLITSLLEEKHCKKLIDTHPICNRFLEFTRIILSPSPIMPFCLCVFCWLVFVFEINMNVAYAPDCSIFSFGFLVQVCCSLQLLLLYFYPWLHGFMKGLYLSPQVMQTQNFI